MQSWFNIRLVTLCACALALMMLMLTSQAQSVTSLDDDYENSMDSLRRLYCKLESKLLWYNIYGIL